MSKILKGVPNASNEPASARARECFCERLPGDPACDCARIVALPLRTSRIERAAIEADGWRTVYCSGERFSFATDAEAEMFAAQHVAVAS